MNCDTHKDNNKIIQTNDGSLEVTGYTINIQEYALVKTAEPEPIRVFSVYATMWIVDEDGHDKDYLTTRRYYFVIEDLVDEEESALGCSLNRNDIGQRMAESHALTEMWNLMIDKEIALYYFPSEEDITTLHG